MAQRIAVVTLHHPAELPIAFPATVDCVGELVLDKRATRRSLQAYARKLILEVVAVDQGLDLAGIIKPQGLESASERNKRPRPLIRGRPGEAGEQEGWDAWMGQAGTQRDVGTYSLKFFPS